MLAENDYSSLATKTPENACAIVLNHVDVASSPRELLSIIHKKIDLEACIVQLDEDECSASVDVEVTVGWATVKGTFSMTGDCEGFGGRFASALRDFVSDLACYATALCEGG